jgi:hypothetical protein
MMLKHLTLGVVLLLSAAGCHRQHRYGDVPPDTRSQVTIQQGVWGNVWFWEGDFMPPGWGTVTPVIRTVYAFEATGFDDVEQVDYSPFYRSIHTRLVDSTVSNSTGFFQLTLAPGQYSFFVREESLFYANGSDNKHILPADVQNNRLTKIQIDINFKACY